MCGASVGLATRRLAGLGLVGRRLALGVRGERRDEEGEGQKGGQGESARHGYILVGEGRDARGGVASARLPQPATVTLRQRNSGRSGSDIRPLAMRGPMASRMTGKCEIVLSQLPRARKAAKPPPVTSTSPSPASRSQVA